MVVALSAYTMKTKGLQTSIKLECRQISRQV